MSNAQKACRTNLSEKLLSLTTKIRQYMFTTDVRIYYIVVLGNILVSRARPHPRERVW